jgi:hypothetical protein
LGFVHARNWAINLTTIVKNESGRTDSNKVNTFSRKGTKDLGGTGFRRNIMSSTFIKLKD